MEGSGHNLVRVWSGLVLAGSLALLVTAAVLEPDPEGLGTHRQMGLPSCSWIAQGSGPCPTCGMTTAFALAAHGRLVQSFQTQPAAAMLAIFTAMAAWISGYTLVTGCTAATRLRALVGLKTLAVVAALMMAAWAYKIAIG